MADYLRFKGAKDISHKKGSDMLLVRNPRGGDTTQVKRWWGTKQTVGYVKCAIFKVNSSVGELRLVIPTDPETTELWINHDGAGNFTFPYNRAIDRCAVFSDDLLTFYREYQFSRISGGPTLTRTVIPYLSPSTSIGDVDITGPAGAVAGTETTAYTAAIAGNAGNLTYAWSSTDASAVFSNQSGSSTTITFSAAASPANVFCDVTSGDENVGDSPLRGEFDVTVTAAFATRVAAADQSYTVTEANGVYELDGVPQAAVTANVGETIAFDFSGISGTHPLGIFTDATKTTPVTVGVEEQGGVLLFSPPIAGSFSYQCINHAAMGGDITVS